jgi:poly(glycerol-phosphate) alpha-glucosyltransferase
VNTWHRRTRKPYLISLHGMLDPWALARARFKKRLASLAYERVHLGNAGCLHALCAQDLESIRHFGLKTPVCLLPNGVDLPGEWMRAPGSRMSEGNRMMVFLGRLHPKKGLANALRAWSRLARDFPEWRFVIAGWDQGGHAGELRQLCKDLGLPSSDDSVAGLLADGDEPGSGAPSRVVFTGPAFGAEKDALLRRADAFILPSFSEGLPMAVLEAWAYGLPVLMTDHCNLPEGFTAGAAVRIGTDPDGIAAGFRGLFEGTPGDLEAMGTRGRHLVEARFTWPNIAAQLKDVYAWLLDAGDRPPCLA